MGEALANWEIVVLGRGAVAVRRRREDVFVEHVAVAGAQHGARTLRTCGRAVVAMRLRIIPVNPTRNARSTTGVMAFA